MIETRSLTYTHPAGPSLRFPDLQVAQGACLLVRGPSGSGKSTWLSLVAGLLTPGGGQLTVAGQALDSLSRSARDTWRGEQVGLLPQRLHLSPSLTVHENLGLAYYALGQPVDTAAIARALQALGVGDLGARRPSQLSGGQAQRVALARAVLRVPRVLLADEPTASLDDASAAQVLALLSSTAHRCDATLVVATHDQRVAQAWPGAQVLEMQGP